MKYIRIIHYAMVSAIHWHIFIFYFSLFVFIYLI